MRTFILFVVLTTAVAAGIFYLTRRPQPIPVRVVTAARGPVASTVVNTRAGTVTPCRRARLSPMVGGIIARWPVHEGMRVKEGELLLALWNDDLLARRQLTAAELTAAEAEVRGSCAEAAAAARRAQRYAALPPGATTADTVDQARTQAETAAAACDRAKAMVAVKKAQLEVLAAEIARTRLTAPFAGIVAELNGELGEYLTPSPPGIQTLPAVDLIDPTCYYVVAPIDEVDVAAVAPGMAARVTLDAFRDRVFPGEVRRVADYVQDREKQARTVDVEVSFKDEATQGQDNILLAGYSADAEIILASHDDVLRVPSEAVVTEAGGQYLFVLEDGRLHRRRVATGLANWQYTEIVDGLAAGAQVVVSVDRPGVADNAPATVETEAGR